MCIRDSYDTLYRTLETYCEQFEEPLNICGLSLGGILAMQYVLISLVIIFKEQLTALVKKILTKITKQSNTI